MIPKFISALSTTVTDVKARKGKVKALHVENPNGSKIFVQFFNALAADVTLGTTAPYYSLVVPANGAMDAWPGGPAQDSDGVEHPVAISVAATTTATGSTAPGTGLAANIFFE